MAVANAGVLGRGATFRNLTATEIEHVMAVNVKGVVNTATAALEAIIDRKGQIVIISSVYAFLNGARSTALRGEQGRRRSTWSRPLI